MVAVSHADPIKAAVAQALGTPLDLFQRIMIAPTSITAVAYRRGGPAVLTVNSLAGDLTWLGGQGMSDNPSFEVDSPDHFTAGAVGPPGQRVFYLQSRDGRPPRHLEGREGAGARAGRVRGRPARPREGRAGRRARARPS